MHLNKGHNFLIQKEFYSRASFWPLCSKTFGQSYLLELLKKIKILQEEVRGSRLHHSVLKELRFQPFVTFNRFIETKLEITMQRIGVLAHEHTPAKMTVWALGFRL